MALGMHLREQITVILPIDDSISDVASYKKYVDDGYNESLLKLSGEPTRFDLRRLSYDQVKYADDLSGSAKTEFIVRASLVQIHNFKVNRGPMNGETLLRLTPEDFEHDRQFDRSMIKLSWMRGAMLPSLISDTLAGFVRGALSEASVPFAKGSDTPAGPIGSCESTEKESQTR